MSTTIEIPTEPRTGASSVLRRLQEDHTAGKFARYEGQWAAYVDGKLAKIGPDDQALFDDLRIRHPGADIALQPIAKLAPHKSKRPRAGSSAAGPPASAWAWCFRKSPSR